MKVRYSVNEAGELVDRDGRSLGKITSVTLDHHEEEGGTIGGEEDRHLVVLREPGEQKKKTTPIAPEIDEIWAHYVKVFDATRQTLNVQRKRVIRNALNVRSAEECKRAIDGLKVSPFHNGENQDGKKYLDIRYALKGNSTKGESDEERIDKMMDTADAHGGGITGGKLPPDHPRVKRWVENVRYAWSNNAEKARGREALIKLRELGYDVLLSDNPKRVKLVASP